MNASIHETVMNGIASVSALFIAALMSFATIALLF